MYAVRPTNTNAYNDSSPAISGRFPSIRDATPCIAPGTLPHIDSFNLSKLSGELSCAYAEILNISVASKAKWLQTAIQLGLIADRDLLDILTTPSLNDCINRLHTVSFNNLASHLNALVVNTLGFCASDWRPFVTFSVFDSSDMPDIDCSSLLNIKLGSPVYISVSALHSIPNRLAKRVAEAISLIDSFLCPLVHPWDSTMEFFYSCDLEDMRFEFRELGGSGALRDVSAAVENVKNRDYFFLSPEHEEIRSFLLRCQLLFANSASWMNPQPNNSTATHRIVKLLTNSLASRKHEDSPWNDIVISTCRILLARCRDPNIWETIAVHHIDGSNEYDSFDNDPLTHVWVTSETPREKEAFDSFETYALECGFGFQYCIDHSTITPSSLLAKLENFSLGLGLLAKIDQINKITKSGRYAFRD